MKKALALTFIIGLIIYGIMNADFLEGDAKTNDSGVVGLEVGNVAPDFTLTTMTGSEVNLTELRGKKVILNFWATWCPPCREEMPDMIKFYKEYKNEVEILAVNMTTYERNPADVEEFISKYQLPFPVLLDTDSSVSDDKYQIMNIPTSYFIGQDGRIQDKVTGAMSYELMKKKLSNMN